MTTDFIQRDPGDRARFAEARALETLRVLTTQLMRTARGSGRPHEIFRQALDFVVAADEYRKVSGFALEPERIAETLAVYSPATPEDEDIPIASDSHSAVESAVAGALQVAASRLAADHLREASGKEQMRTAFELWKVRGYRGCTAPAVKTTRTRKKARSRDGHSTS